MFGKCRFRKRMIGILCKLSEQRLRLLQIARVEPLSEPAVDWSEKITSLISLALVAPEAGEPSKTSIGAFLFAILRFHCFTCSKNCSSIARACGPARCSSRSSASAVVAGRSKLPGGPTSTRCTFAKGTRVSKYLVAFGCRSLSSSLADQTRQPDQSNLNFKNLRKRDQTATFLRISD